MAINFIVLNESHFPLIHRWLQEPHVKKWWKDKEFESLASIENKYKGYIENHNGVFAFIICNDDKEIGFIQYYTTSSKENKGAGIDFYIGEKEYLKQGLSFKIIDDFLNNYVFTVFDYCIVDPDCENLIAIKLCEKLGFAVHSRIEDFVIMIKFKKA